MSKIGVTPPEGWSAALRRWLGRVPVSHPLERRQALALQAGLLVLLGANLPMLVFSLLNSVPAAVPAVLLSNLLFLGLLGAGLVLLRRGQIQRAALVSAGGLMLVMDALLPLVGLRAGGALLVLVMLAALLAALLVRGRALAGLLVLSCAAVAATALLENAHLPPVGTLPPVPNLPATYATVTIVALMVQGTLLYRFSGALRHAIDESLAAQSDLEAVRAAQAVTIARQTEDLRQALHKAEQREERLAQALAELRESQQTLRALSAPAIPVLPGVLIVPLVGVLDAARAELLDGVLEAVEQRRARQVLLDITGVALVDQAAARQVLQLALAVRLLGARLWLIGVRPEVAQALVALGVPLDDIPTSPDLQSAVATLRTERRAP